MHEFNVTIYLHNLAASHKSMPLDLDIDACLGIQSRSEETFCESWRLNSSPLASQHFCKMIVKRFHTQDGRIPADVSPYL